MHTLAAEEEVAVALAHKQLAHEPLYMNGREHCSINDIRVLAHQVKDLRLVVIDYLGLLKPTRHYNSRYEEVTAISGELKALARSLGVPVPVSGRSSTVQMKCARTNVLAWLIYAIRVQSNRMRMESFSCIERTCTD